MKYLLLLFCLTFFKFSYSQNQLFGTYILKTSLSSETARQTILQLKCDYTYSRADSISKDWGTWKLNKKGEFVLSIDTMSSNGRTERFQVKVYFDIVNGQLKLNEREYSKSSYKKFIKDINQSYKSANKRFRTKYTDEGYEYYKRYSMNLYFEKTSLFTCQ